MKKIISILIAVLMLCTLAVPAYAEDLPELIYSQGSDFTVTISESKEYGHFTFNPWGGYKGTVTIDNNAIVTVGSAMAFNTNWTVKSGSILRVIGDFEIAEKATLTIEEGAKLILLPGVDGFDRYNRPVKYYEGSETSKELSIRGNLIVKGEVLGEVYKYDTYYTQNNDIDILGNGAISLNYIYDYEIDPFVSDLQKNADNIVTYNKDQKTIVAEYAHHFGEDAHCKYCGIVDPDHQCAYGANFRCVCGALDPTHTTHIYDENTYTCPCGMVKEHPHKLDPITFTCPCGYHKHNYDETTDLCPCGLLKPGHVHDFTKNDNHSCRCGAFCAHINGFTNGICNDCHHSCLHDGTCDLCGETFQTVNDIEEGYYMICTAIDETMALDIDGGAASIGVTGKNAHIWHNGFAKVYSLTKDAENDSYTLESKNTNLVLGVAGGSMANNANVIQWSADGSDNQKWVFENAGNGHYYIRTMGTRYMTVKDSKAQDGTVIVTNDFTGAGNQMFKLVKVDANGNRIGDGLNLGSALSEGNLTLIVGIAAAAIFGFGGFFLGTKKKKPATANGAPAQNKDDEE